eukprot:2474012-Prymnesium_polylepis.1
MHESSKRAPSPPDLSRDRSLISSHRSDCGHVPASRARRAVADAAAVLAGALLTLPQLYDEDMPPPSLDGRHKVLLVREEDERVATAERVGAHGASRLDSLQLAAVEFTRLREHNVDRQH